MIAGPKNRILPAVDPNGPERIPLSQKAMKAPQLNTFVDETFRPMRARIRDIANDVGPLDEDLVSMATMARWKDGRSLRTFTGGKAHENGFCWLYKRRGLAHWQGIAQRALIVRTETDHRFERIETESIRLEFSIDGAPHQYTLDVCLIAPDGSIVAVEVKRDERDLEDPQLRRNLAAAYELFRRCGIRLEILYRDEIFVSRKHRFNAELFASRCLVEPGRAQIDRLENHAAKMRCASTYGELAEALEPGRPVYGKALIMALTVRRRIEIDLRKRLTDNTPLIIH